MADTQPPRSDAAPWSLAGNTAIDRAVLSHMADDARAGHAVCRLIPAVTHLEHLIDELADLADPLALAVVMPTVSQHAFTNFLALTAKVQAAGATTVTLIAHNTGSRYRQHLADNPAQAASLAGLSAAGLTLCDTAQPLKTQLLSIRYPAATFTISATASLFSDRIAQASDLDVLTCTPTATSTLAPWLSTLAANSTTVPVAVPATTPGIVTASMRQALWRRYQPDRVTEGVLIGGTRYTIFEYDALELTIYDALSEPVTCHAFLHHRPAAILARAQKLGRITRLYRVPTPSDHLVTTQQALTKLAGRLFHPANQRRPVDSPPQTT
ncbi:hypothetical protein [Lacticaseibacillus kribbianus]|uniref:hypothetical protein n=1 Tax=Lacticaseibacillus kribbianus TaxID=2926292 RepID=UPI001CD77AF6|nr:hypothetical protein [Lacticaseibacillus kribbianus]